MLKLHTDNFHLNEMVDKDYDAIIPCDEKSELFEGLEIYKEEVSKVYDINMNDIKVVISSGDRIGDDGEHGKGKAADIYTELPDKTLSTVEQMKIIESLNIFTGRGLYLDDGYIIHVDVRNGLKDGSNVIRWIREDGEYRTYKNHYNDKPFDGHVYPLEED